MHDGGAAILRQYAFEPILVANVAFDYHQRLAADSLHPVEGLGTAIAEIVKNNDLLAGEQQGNTCMRADITAASGHQYHWALELAGSARQNSSRRSVRLLFQAWAMVCHYALNQLYQLKSSTSRPISLMHSRHRVALSRRFE
jgi:hypothetical protein